MGLVWEGCRCDGPALARMPLFIMKLLQEGEAEESQACIQLSLTTNSSLSGQRQ
jgi:hypothetical protein